MYFLLLKGTHLEGAKKYCAIAERDAKSGIPKVVGQPVVESPRDLVVAFGSEKFRRISNDEAKILLKAEMAAGQQGTTNPAPAVTVESDVAKAAKAGATEIAKPPGVDVTGKFPELSEWPAIVVYFKRGVGYFIADRSEGKVITETPIKRKDIVEWVGNYMEG